MFPLDTLPVFFFLFFIRIPHGKIKPLLPFSIPSPDFPSPVIRNYFYNIQLKISPQSPGVELNIAS